MPRLFIAVDLPTAHRAALSKLVTTTLVGARWVPQEQLHLTLRFLGEVGDATFVRIKEVLTSVRFQPFPLSLEGLGHFPPGRHPRVLWVGLTPSTLLLDLQRDVELSLIDAGITPDERRFSPHVTLARLHGTPFGDVAAVEAAPADWPQEPFTVSEFILYSSVLTQKGAIHSKEAVYSCYKVPAIQSS